MVIHPFSDDTYSYSLMEDTIHNCHSCKHTAKLIEGEEVFVKCSHCGAEGPKFPKGINSEGKIRAAKEWNKRNRH